LQLHVFVHPELHQISCIKYNGHIVFVYGTICYWKYLHLHPTRCNLLQLGCPHRFLVQIAFEHM
jgi:hypothetical protein